MRLFFKGNQIGVVTLKGSDHPWLIGVVELNAAGEELRAFFSWIVDEENFTQDPPFDEDLLAEESWELDADGDLKGISMPGIYPNNEIRWRWR